MRRVGGENPCPLPAAPSDSGRAAQGRCGRANQWAGGALGRRSLFRALCEPREACDGPSRAPCARAAHLALSTARKREARAVELAKRAPRPCAKCGGIIDKGRAPQARYCAECARMRGPQDRYCMGCGVYMGTRRKDAKCRPCARAWATVLERVNARRIRRAKRKARAGLDGPDTRG